jgi:hypothetical protein
VSYRLDAAGRRGGPNAPVEVALTARGDLEKGVSLQTAYNTFVLIGSDGLEYQTDGNTYGRSGAEIMKRGRPMQKGEQVVLTLVFPKVPQGVTAARLLVKGAAGVAEFYLAGAPLNRPQYAPEPAPPGGVPAGQVVELKAFKARLISMNRGDDGDWEAVVGFQVDSGLLKRVAVSDLDISIFDASGETRHAIGDFYVAEDLSRKRLSTTLMLPPAVEMRVRMWFPESANLQPARYKLYESYGMSKGGPISAGFLAGGR